MRFITITIFAVAGRLVALATAKPIPNWKAGGIAIPLTRHASILNSNESIDLDAISSHGISVREKILTGLDNYEMNTGTMHPFAVRRSDSGLRRRSASLPLTHGQKGLWIADISIGTPAKTLRLIIDTGSADMWVLETGCSGISPDHDLWDPDSSDSAKYGGPPFELKYTDGTIVKGDQYDDNVTIAGFTADPQIFGSVTSYTSQISDIVGASGLLGLAFPSISKFGASPLFESLVKQGKVTNPIFSLKLSSSGAEMYVGGTNSMLYNGDISYTRVTVPGFWQVSMDDVRVDGNKILENVPAIFDTGATYIYGDWNRVSEMYRRIGGILYEHKEFGYYYLPCDSFPTLGFAFGGRVFDIPPEVLRLAPMAKGSPKCFSAIVALRSPIGEILSLPEPLFVAPDGLVLTIGPVHWSIGMPFLKGVYSVFNYGTLQVGFADLA